MAAALANRAMGAIVGSAVADAAGNDVGSLLYCCVMLYPMESIKCLQVKMCLLVPLPVLILKN